MCALKYSLDWADRIVAVYLEKYPRATDICMEVLGIEPKDLSFALAKPDPLWNNFKKLVTTACLWAHSPGANGFYAPNLDRFRADLRTHALRNHYTLVK